MVSRQDLADIGPFKVILFNSRIKTVLKSHTMKVYDLKVCNFLSVKLKTRTVYDSFSLTLFFF